MSPRYRFHEYELQPAPPFLLKAGEPVAVSSQVLILLRTLVERRGELVSKSELAQAVWGHGHQSDAALARALMRTRRLLGDDGEEQRFIRTVHGRGLIFVAPVLTLADAEDTASAPDPAAAMTHDTSGPANPERRPRAWAPKVRWLGVLAALLVVAAWALYEPPPPDQNEPGEAAPAERVLLLAPIELAPEDEDARALASSLPRMLSPRLAPLGVRLIHAEEAGMEGDPDSFREWLEANRGAADAAGILQLRLQRTADGWRPELHLEGLAAGRVELPAVDTVDVLPAISRALKLRLLGGSLRDEALIDTDPLLHELELRAHVAWAKADREAALRAIEAGLALRQDYWPLQLLQIEVGLGGHAGEAAEALLRRLDSVRTAGDGLQRALLLQRAGVASWYAGDAITAQNLLEAALAAAQAAQAPLTEALSRNSLSMALQSRGAIEEAWTQAQLAVGALRRLQHPYHLGFALTNLAYLAEERGRLAIAEQLHAEALALREGLGLKRLVPASQYGLARIERRKGALAQAEARALEADAQMLAMGLDMDRISVLEELAVITLLQGRFETSAAHLDRAETLALQLDDRLGQAWLMDVRARLRVAEGRVSEAIPLFTQSIALQQAQGELNESRYSEISLLDARLRLHGAEDPDAIALRRRLAEAEPALSHDQQAALANVALRERRNSARAADAEAACTHALGLARVSGAADHEAEAALECALLYRALNRPDDAQLMHELARSWSPQWHALKSLDDGAWRLGTPVHR